MKRKIFRALLALVLVLSFSLVTAAPALATGEYGNWYFASDGDGAAAWSTTQAHDDTYSAAIGGGTAGGSGSYAQVWKPVDITLADITAVSFWYYISSTSQADNSAWPIYEQEGQTYTDTTAYLSPYVILQIYNGSSTHWIISQPFARDPDGTWTAGWEQWQMTDNAAEYPASSGMDPTQALWHDEAFANNDTETGDSGAYPAGWEYLSHWQTTYSGYDVVKLKIVIGEWAFTTDQTAYVDDITVTAAATQYAVEPRVFITTTPYGAIQTAIDAASASDTITVYPGTYEEDLTVDETGLTLESTEAGAATTTILSAGSPNDIVLVTAAGVTIDGFTIEGLSDTSGIVNGIDLRNSGFTIENNIFEEIYGDNIYTGDTATAITAGLIDGNTLTGMGTGAKPYRPAINVESPTTSTAISGVTVSDNTISAYGGVESAGIQVAEVTGAVSGIVVSGNTISDCSFGIATWNDAAGTFTDNTVTGCDVGVDIYGDTNPLTPLFTFSENTITGHADYGIRVRSDANALTAVGVVIKYNDISGNGDGVSVACTGTLNSAPVALYNYWGDESGPTVSTNARGAGDSVEETVTTVTYEPWLHTTQATVYPSGTRYYAYNWCDLTTGWNIWSTPIAPDTQADTWGEYKVLGVDLDLASDSNAYYFVGSSQSWASVTDSYELTPCDAIYIKVASTEEAPILFSPTYSAPSKTLYAGWNLVSASYIDSMDSPTITTGDDPENVLASVYTVAGANSTGYSQVVSPAVNQTAWTGYRGQTIDAAVGGSNTMLPTKGYWVFMTNAGTLAGAVFTPVSPLQ